LFGNWNIKIKKCFFCSSCIFCIYTEQCNWSNAWRQKRLDGIFNKNFPPVLVVLKSARDWNFYFSPLSLPMLWITKRISQQQVSKVLSKVLVYRQVSKILVYRHLHICSCAILFCLLSISKKGTRSLPAFEETRNARVVYK
jgi:hypothetical protein